LRDPESHFYYDKIQIEDIDSLTRLKLKYQAYKAGQMALLERRVGLIGSGREDSRQYN
jgi:hypothetical protein